MTFATHRMPTDGWTADASDGDAMSVESELPVPLSLEICDFVWTDPLTLKTSLLGCFDSITARAFPTMHPSLTVRVVLTDGKPPYDVTFAVVTDEEEVIASHLMPTTLGSPLAVQQMRVEFLGLTFPKQGQYFIRVTVHGEIVAERRLMLLNLGDER